ncbi:VanZ family protein [Streptomyces cucumeris]|uniref:VanZ family protein n=1 Tax=Streptomyces cucumeris TaxID=2962890 RepID=UPI003D75271F
MVTIAGWEIRKTGAAKTTGAKKTPKSATTKKPAETTKKKAAGVPKKTTAAKTTTAAKKTAAKRTPAKKTTAGKASATKTSTTRTTEALPPKTPPKTRPKPKPEVAEAPAPATETAAAPRRPLLQRDSWQAQAARVLVLLLAFVCMVGFAVALAGATLVPSPGSSDLVHTNMRPGASLRAYLDQPAFQDTVKQIGGNVLLGAPFGVLLPMLMPRARGAVRVVLVTGLVMVMVETAQGLIVEGRAFDVDDVILNTSGALLGYVLIGRLLGRALHPRRRHWWHRWTKASSSSAAGGPAA